MPIELAKLHPIRFHKDSPVDKLRWVMLGAMLADIILTISSQPQTFWSDPSLAIRGDGLSIHDPTNHFFEFFLGYGCPAFLAISIAYVAATFFLVSVLPRSTALVLLFTVVLGHTYLGTNWLAIRWHAGMLASSVYGLFLGLPLAIIVERFSGLGMELNRRVGWVAVVALLIDMSFTLVGQPHSYWSNPATAYEGNVVSRYFLIHGWPAFAAYDIVYALFLFFLVTALPRLAGLVVGFYFVICDFDGASNWLFFVWRRGIESVLVFACMLSIALAILAFRRDVTLVKCLPTKI